VKPRALDALIGVSEPIASLRQLIRTVAPTRLPVLIEGPTGAGKELVAAAIHEESGRRGDFVPFNVCAIGESMFEDALFGHVRGAFTGAMGDTLGFLREANGGTAFFDEVSGLQPAMQAKLLRAVETGQFRPVGGKRDAQSDFRVVAATNEPVAGLVIERRLRADLAYRLSGVVLRVPPLCDRRGDIPGLVSHFLGRTALSLEIEPAAVSLLQEHPWPGNVRELRNVVECAAALGGVRVAIVRVLLAQQHGDTAGAVMVRRERLRAALEANHWNPDSAARELGIHRATIYRWMKEARIVVPA